MLMIAERCDGLARKTLYLILWYAFSLGTLFLNKYILTWHGGSPSQLASTQMIATTLCGGAQLAITRATRPGRESSSHAPSFARNMIILGVMRFVTVVLGLVSLANVAVSFTETIKASAPMFTVLIARCMIGERTGLLVNLSLGPIMAGLALCSATELSFNVLGFAAALFNNIVDCFQNVFSKKLLSQDTYSYSPVELQFYASAASFVLQLPYWIFYLEIPQKPSSFLMWLLLANGLLFHLQSLTAYALMSLISPVTHSVANTVKRALLIWLSILAFGNPVTNLSAVGTAMVIAGVVFYNRARQAEKAASSHRIIRVPSNHLIIEET